MIQGQTYRLIPSTYSLSNTQYMTITNANDALSNTDSTSYATVTHTSNSTTSYYLYLSGFNFDIVPNDEDIISFAIKIKAYESGLSTSTNYSPRIQINNTNQTGTCPAINTTARVLQFTGVTATFDTIKSAGNNFRLQLYVRRSSRNTQGYLYVYGAEIEVVTGNKYEINVTSNSASSITVPSYQTVSEYSSTTLTFNNVTDIATLAFIDNGVNVTSKLINTSGDTYTYTIDNIDEDHNIVINDVPAYNITVTENDPSNIFSISPLGVTRIGKGSDIEITITTDDRDSILIYDNNENVSQSLVPGKELSSTINEDSFGLSQYESGTLSITGTNYSAANGANSSSNTASHARFYTATAGTLLDAVYAFNVNIPNDAEIVSVSCTVRGYCYNGSSYYTIRTVQLYAGNVPMGSAYTFPTSNETFNLTCGDWTAAQLANCKLKILCNSTSTSTSYNIRFYGATLTVQYKEYLDSDTISIYTISNIGAEHNVVINEAPYKLISGTSSFTGKGFSNLPKKIYVSGGSFTVILSGITNRYSFRLSDNNNDVTSSVNTSNYQYTISNITADHTLVLSESTKYAVTGTSNLTGAGFSGLGNVYQGDNITITLTGITNQYSFNLFDNDVDVTSNISSNQYVISNITADHSLRIEEAPYYEVTATVTYPNASITGTSNKVYEGDSITVTLVGISDPDSFRFYDNGFLATSSVTSNYQFTIFDIQTDHELLLEEIPHYSVTEGNSTLSGATFTGLTNKVYEGNDVTITIEGVSDPYSIKLTDNGVDVSDKLTYPTTSGNGNSTYSVAIASGASYGFTLNNDGYYESQNKGQNSSAAVARVTFNLVVRSRITIKYINYAEATYDYGIFGDVDATLNTTSTADTTNVYYACSQSSDNTEDVQTLTYDINSGEHYIDIKFRKDSYTESGNDSLQFKIDSIEALETIITYPEYLIPNISSNHVLVVSLQDTITVTTSSSYNGASLSPASSTVYKGKPIELTLTVSDISLVSVRVTNSNTSMITGIFTDNGNGTYTGILTVRENSTVTVIQKVTYTITCTDNATNGNITPTGSQSIDGGYDAEYIIESDHFDRIYLKDNNVIVNDSFERHELPETTNTFIPASFDSTNSTYSSVYNSNNPENGLTASNSSTRCCVYSNTGANAVSKLIYNFDCSSIPENATIDSVTCTVGAACYSSGQYFATRTLQLYSGDTAKGTATTITGNGGTNTSHTLNCGSWTRDELNNIKIVVYIARSTSNTTTDASFSFWGATLSITYHEDYYSYTIENVSAAHTLVLSDRPTYQLTASSTTQTGTITPVSSTIYENNSAEFILTVNDITKIRLMDNDVDVTESIIYDDGNFKYIIDAVLGIHTIVLKDKLIVYHKINNQYIAIAKIYKKISGVWVEQTTADNLFDSNKIYINK